MSTRIWNFKLVFVLMALLVALPITSCMDRQKAIERSQIHYRMALDLDSKGETTQALAQALQANKLNPRDPEIHNLLGLMFTRNAMFDKAEDHFYKAISLDEGYSEARNNLCVLYIEQGMFDKAIEQGLKAVENITYISPERAYNNVGWAYYKKGDTENAMKYFKKALLHNKEFFLPYMNIAKIYYQAGNYEKAKESYENSIRNCKECTILYYDLGLTLLKLKDRDGAIKSFEQCASISKDRENGQYGRKCANKLAALK